MVARAFHETSRSQQYLVEGLLAEVTYALLILRPPVAALEKRIAFQNKSFQSHFTGTSSFTGDTPCHRQSFRIPIFFNSPVLSIESFPTPPYATRGHPAPHALYPPPPHLLVPALTFDRAGCEHARCHGDPEPLHSTKPTCQSMGHPRPRGSHIVMPGFHSADALSPPPPPSISKAE